MRPHCHSRNPLTRPQSQGPPAGRGRGIAAAWTEVVRPPQVGAAEVAAAAAGARRVLRQPLGVDAGAQLKRGQGRRTPAGAVRNVSGGDCSTCDCPSPASSRTRHCRLTLSVIEVPADAVAWMSYVSEFFFLSASASRAARAMRCLPLRLRSRQLMRRQ